MNSAVEKKIQEIVSGSTTEDAFCVLDIGALDAQFKLWQEHLPRVVPHYAVKCNNHPELLRQLYSLGSKFDCASQEEIKLALELGATGSDIIYANAVKAPSQLRYAATQAKVRRTTFDNADELHKIVECGAEGIELLLRIKTDDSMAVCSLSCKFGAALQLAEPLLAEAQELGLNVVGVAYHVGSGGGTGAASHREALCDARAVFDLAREKFGLEMHVLDIGGGFDSEANQFIEVAREINAQIDRFPPNVEVIAEPGRFMVAPVMTLAACVIGVRHAGSAEEKDMVYITDGVYGNLNSILYDHQEPHAVLLAETPAPAPTTATTPATSVEVSLWGPTCDGLDAISSSMSFPRPLRRGDWLCFVECGAYTLVGGSSFNGFNTNTRVFVV